jgi:methyltransferase (TIGR00027 family)
MSKPLRILVFAIVELVLYPVTMLGGILFVITFVLGVRGKGISFTTYDPLIARWLLDVLGDREDAGSRQLIYAVPGMSRVPLWLALGPSLLAMRLTGLRLGLYDYPTHESANIYGILGHRTTFLDAALCRCLDSVEQVVILGAGWDTRAYGPARQEGLRVYEVDRPAMQAAKREALAKAGIDSPRVRYAAVDFNKESWLAALARVGFQPAAPTFVLWEGVTYYLEAQAVQATLRTVATQLGEGSAIAFDYAAEHIVAGDTSAFLRFALWEARMLGGGWRSGLGTNPPARERLSAYLGEQGLRLLAFEPIGQGDREGRVDGGLALAVKG